MIPTASADELRESLLQRIGELNRQLPTGSSAHTVPPPTAQPDIRSAVDESRLRVARPLVDALQSFGLLPVHAQYVADQLPGSQRHARETDAEALALATDVLRSHWNHPAPISTAAAGTHVFIGGPGVGKTTCLCKWLAQAVLLGGHAARVWRLDGRTANMAEALNLYGEVLGVPVERSWPKAPAPAEELQFVDLPGVNWRDSGAVRELGERVSAAGPAQLHLVLNAAYETRLLLAQAEAFAELPVTDLLFTHLDEEPRWGKLWNFVFGTNCALGHLSAGQSVPGEFLRATPENISPGSNQVIASVYGSARGR